MPEQRLQRCSSIDPEFVRRSRRVPGKEPSLSESCRPVEGGALECPLDPFAADAEISPITLHVHAFATDPADILL